MSEIAGLPVLLGPSDISELFEVVGCLAKFGQSQSDIKWKSQDQNQNQHSMKACKNGDHYQQDSKIPPFHKILKTCIPLLFEVLLLSNFWSERGDFSFCW